MNPFNQEDLLLGWDIEDQGGLGFAHSRCRHDTQSPLIYNGDSHLLTIAPTGAGKGRSVIIPVLLTHNSSTIVFDPKGEAYHVTGRRRREMGHKVIKLDPFGVIDDASDGLNPLDIFNMPSADVETDAQMLAEQLTVGIRGTKEPFWDISGASLDSGLISYVASAKETKDRHFGSVIAMLTADDAVYNMAVALDTQKQSMTKLAYREIASFLQMPELTRGGVLATASSYVKPLNSARVLKTLEKSSFDLQEIVEGQPLTVYIIIPPDKLISHKGLYKLWIATLLKAVTSRRHIPRQRTLFLLDEAGQLESFRYIETIMTLFRGMGVQLWTFWQDISQLRHAYPTSYESILNNAAVVQTFGIANYLAAQQWAQVMNRSPKELINLSPDEQIVFIQGQGDRRCRKADYLIDKPFADHFDPNPLFAHTKIAPHKDRTR